MASAAACILRDGSPPNLSSKSCRVNRAASCTLNPEIISVMIDPQTIVGGHP